MRLGQVLTYSDGIDRVHWVFEAEQIPRFAPPCNRIFEIAEEVAEGWLWNGGTPCPDPNPPVYEPPPPPYPPPTLDEKKASKRTELMTTRDNLIAAGFDWNGHHYPLSPELSSDMLIKLTAMQMLPPPPEYVYQWKDATGVYRDIGNTEAFKAFCAAALGYGEALFARERMLQEFVEAAETVEAVEAVSWDTVPKEG